MIQSQALIDLKLYSIEWGDLTVDETIRGRGGNGFVRQGVLSRGSQPIVVKVAVKQLFSDASKDVQIALVRSPEALSEAHTCSRVHSSHSAAAARGQNMVDTQPLEHPATYRLLSQSDA